MSHPLKINMAWIGEICPLTLTRQFACESIGSPVSGQAFPAGEISVTFTALAITDLSLDCCTCLHCRPRPCLWSSYSGVRGRPCSSRPGTEGWMGRTWRHNTQLRTIQIRMERLITAPISYLDAWMERLITVRISRCMHAHLGPLALLHVSVLCQVLDQWVKLIPVGRKTTWIILCGQRQNRHGLTLCVVECVQTCICFKGVSADVCVNFTPILKHYPMHPATRWWGVALDGNNNNDYGICGDINVHWRYIDMLSAK